MVHIEEAKQGREDLKHHYLAWEFLEGYNGLVFPDTSNRIFCSHSMFTSICFNFVELFIFSGLHISVTFAISPAHLNYGCAERPISVCCRGGRKNRLRLGGKFSVLLNFRKLGGDRHQRVLEIRKFWGVLVSGQGTAFHGMIAYPQLEATQRHHRVPLLKFSWNKTANVVLRAFNSLVFT